MTASTTEEMSWMTQQKWLLGQKCLASTVSKAVVIVGMTLQDYHQTCFVFLDFKLYCPSKGNSFPQHRTTENRQHTYNDDRQ